MPKTIACDFRACAIFLQNYFCKFFQSKKGTGNPSNGKQDTIVTNINNMYHILYCNLVVMRWATFEHFAVRVRCTASGCLI